MNAIYTRDITVLPSQVDIRGELGVADTFSLFMDTATEAAEAIGVGWGMLMKRGLFWITVKTRVQFLERPKLMERVEVLTWPQRPEAWRCDRHYEIRRGGRALVRGKTEWAIVSTLTRKPQRLDQILPEALEYPDACACPEPFPMIDEAFDAPPFAEHRVTATDIDMARHMNNVAYVRAIVNAFSVQQWQRLDVKQMDVIFRASAHEGDALQLRQRRDGRALDIRGSLPDGQTIVLARLICG